MERTPQNIASHVRFDPLYHFFLVPVAVLMLIGAIWAIITDPAWHSLRYLVFSAWLIVLLLRVRTYPLRVQDRVIRLEERLRLASLMPGETRIAQLTEAQLIALRFASDDELPGLAARALDEGLGPKEIKAAIRNWRPDYWRV